jgi:hypothetical protein
MVNAAVIVKAPYNRELSTRNAMAANVLKQG